MSDSHATAVAHHPELRHHFSDMGQQQNSATLGMWLFLVTEIMFFGGMFCAYLVYRLRHFNDFAAASQQLTLWMGAVNTGVLLVSSWTMAMAVRSAQLGKKKLLVMFLVLTLIFGLAFLGIKAIEYHEKFVHNHVPGPSFHFEPERMAGHVNQPPINERHAEMFFSLYFAMTGMHALHMVIGAGLLTYLILTAWAGKYSGAYYTPVENIGLYWHFVDVIWIYLFPLLYLISRHP
jgi:cytochrome c oxidase subunit 3